MISPENLISIPLITTKLYIPNPRPTYIHRSELTKQLNSGLSRKLTLISAPAGFGKTTLVSSWTNQVERPVGWFFLDEEDNDPHRFFTYVTTAIQPLLGEVELVNPQPDLPIKAMMTMLVRDLDQLSTSRLLLENPDNAVIDDIRYHHLSSTTCIENRN